MDSKIDEWDRCRKFLEPSVSIYMDTGGHTLEDYAVGVKAGYFQLWPGDNAAAITGTSYAPEGECVNVLIAGGDGDGVMKILDEIESSARRGGAASVMALGRIGWRKEAKSRGWDHIASVFYKRLEH